MPLRTRFRGIDVRDGVLVRGPAGWGEFSPFWDYDVAESRRWWAAARGGAPSTAGPSRCATSVPVNVTVPAVDAGAGARDRHRVGLPHREGEGGRARADARPTTWPGSRRSATRSGPTARSGSTRTPPGTSTPRSARIARARPRSGSSTSSSRARPSTELVALRRRIDVRVAADEVVRRAADPLRVDLREACDVVVLKVQPLGGVRAALRVAEAHGLPCVVSSALESSVGIAAGVALAAALPELPFACGLATVALFTDDVSSAPLLPVDGALPVPPARARPARRRGRRPGDRRPLAGAAGRGAARVNPSTAFARVLVDELVRGGVTDAVLAPGLAVGAGRAGARRRRAGRPAAAARAHRRADGGLPRARAGQGVRAGRCRC